MAALLGKTVAILAAIVAVLMLIPAASVLLFSMNGGAIAWSDSQVNQVGLRSALAALLLIGSLFVLYRLDK